MHHKYVIWFSCMRGVFLWLECVEGKNDNAVFQEQIWHYFRLTLFETTGIVVFKKYIYYEETILMDVHVL